ncbi:Rrf2 family transcriptional regulator [bacterium]|nr:Rrf2 family transcriptional regulator [bacterium]
MITKTSDLGIQATLYLAMRAEDTPVPPRVIAEVCESSATYTAKVIQHLVRSGIMRSTKGSKGGVTLALHPREISLLSIVEACQGKILAEYCEDFKEADRLCGLHKAMMQLNTSITKVLTQWTVQSLVDNPTPHDSVRAHVNCKLRNVCAMCTNCVFE